jgi:hypothetical protein
MAGCPAPAPDPGELNTTDKTNAGAKFVGAASCRQCHSDVAAIHERHGHAFAALRATGAPPDYPAGTSPGVPAPPAERPWTDVAYLVGGYTKAALFVDQNGFFVSADDGAATQWNLGFAANGTSPGFAAYGPPADAAQPFDYDCFRCHSTGAAPFSDAAPQFVDGRAGMAGSWSEPGVQCEACHGPGGNHFATVDGQVQIRLDRIFVDLDSSQTCRTCHSRAIDPADTTILAADGFVRNYQQWNELRASGGHAGFHCGFCHTPHESLAYAREDAIRNECRACHPEATMAGHGGEVYVRGDYREELSCESCHMPYAVRNASSVLLPTRGDLGRVGDVRSHIFRIRTTPEDVTGLVTAAGDQVVLDDQGRAALTVDFVCLRCHIGDGLFPLSVERAAEIAPNVHALPE